MSARARLFAAFALLALAAAVLLMAPARATSGAGGVPKTSVVATRAMPRSSLAGRPGYVPLVDPESTAVLLGRRTSAPLAKARLAGGAKSLDQLGRRVVRYLRDEQRDSLLALCVSDEEFAEILWREFPQSRPATGLQWQDAWTILHARQRSGCWQAVGDYGGTAWEFVRFEREPRADSLFRYKNFTTHNGLWMVVKGPEGQLERWNWLRSVVQRRGVYKIYSTAD